MSTTQLPVWIVEELRVWIQSRKTGSLEISFFQGGVSNVVRKESLKKTEMTAART